ncbi:MAG: D-tyrosyl-tRNA(Tyr) deacylase [Nitrospirae bacterium]|nr:MAG: D-tyrosyl-tRNA(Tyr) deacylase [Nitrospirota bacterium]
MMKALIQRVTKAGVLIEGAPAGSIGHGLVVLLGVEKGDTENDASFLARKCTNMRIFEDTDGKMNLSVKDIRGGMLVVSQFTLCSDCRKGNRPSFDHAELPERARVLYDLFVRALSDAGIQAVTGQFGAYMQIELVNDGPVTFILDSRK